MKKHILKRPILVATIGYIIGIIWGLYLQISIVPFYIPIIAIIFLIKKFCQKKSKFKLFSIKRYFRYIKIIITPKVVATIIFFSIISNSIVIFQNKKYENTYSKLESMESIRCKGIIASNLKEGSYNNIYEVKIESINDNSENIKLYLMIDKKKKIKLNYADEIEFEGDYQKPDIDRNYGGFNYLEYLKTKQIYGSVEAKKVKVIDTNKQFFLFSLANNIKKKIEERATNILNKENVSIYEGLIVGDTNNIEEEVKQDFRAASFSHVLAISGMHIGYLIMGVMYCFKKIFGKKLANIFTTVFILFYMIITGFSPSVVRAGIMGIMMSFSSVVYRKNDIYTAIFLSLFLILIYNPFLINNVGLQLSYLGVLGIVLFNKTINEFLNFRNKKENTLIKEKFKQIISVIISAQIFVIPVTIFHFNTFSIYFLITNFILSFIIGPIIITGLIFTITLFIHSSLAKVISIALNFGIGILLKISSICNTLPFSEVYIPTTNVIYIFLLLCMLFIFFLIYKIVTKKKPSATIYRIKNILYLLKTKFKKRYLLILLVFILTIYIVNLIPKDLKIHFIDVGQGDSTFIETPMNKTILIDGGGSLAQNFDVGKMTLIPYLLDKGYNKIDYVMISHFDSDHVGGILTLLQEFKVGRVFISKQFEESENYKKFLQIVEDKKVKVSVVKKGDVINIEKNLKFKIISPGSVATTTNNVLNNNALVEQLVYNKFSCLFTADVEKEGEEKILEEGTEIKSTILKVGHHGSKNSTTENFLKKVSPQIALIGVGKNNLFGHPSDEAINRLQKFGTKIYRTDLNGEITITINNKQLKIVAKN